MPTKMAKWKDLDMPAQLTVLAALLNRYKDLIGNYVAPADAEAIFLDDLRKIGYEGPVPELKPECRDAEKIDVSGGFVKLRMASGQDEMVDIGRYETVV